MKQEYKILIPKERVGPLIGEHGRTKRKIEKLTKTKIVVNEEEITISGESYDAWVCLQVVKAIGRGFNPNIALNLIKDDYVFELINVMDYAKNKNAKIRLKGRVIGEDGKVRQKIEESTGCKISIYGKTIGIIGKQEDIKVARDAVIKLLQGAQIDSVFRYLAKERKKKLKLI